MDLFDKLIFDGYLFDIGRRNLALSTTENKDTLSVELKNIINGDFNNAAEVDSIVVNCHMIIDCDLLMTENGDVIAVVLNEIINNNMNIIENNDSFNLNATIVPMPVSITDVGKGGGLKRKKKLTTIESKLQSTENSDEIRIDTVNQVQANHHTKETNDGIRFNCHVSKPRVNSSIDFTESNDGIDAIGKVFNGSRIFTVEKSDGLLFGLDNLGLDSEEEELVLLLMASQNMKLM